MNIYIITTILLIVLLIGMGYYIYSTSTETPSTNSVANPETSEISNNILTSSELASAESVNFRACAMEKFKDNLEVMTLKEDLKQDNDPLWFGGCNGNWLRPICEAAIVNMTDDSDDSFKTALSDCMIKELY